MQCFGHRAKKDPNQPRHQEKTPSYVLPWIYVVHTGEPPPVVHRAFLLMMCSDIGDIVYRLGDSREARFLFFLVICSVDARFSIFKAD